MMKSYLAALLFLFACSAAPEIGREGVTSLALSGADAGTPPALDVTGATCSEQALQALLNPPRDGSLPVMRLRVELPTGAKIRLCDPVHVNDPVHLEANGARVFADSSTGLVDLLHIWGERVQIDDIEMRYMIAAPQSAPNTAIALAVHATQFTLRDSYISGAGTGVSIVAGGGENLNWPHLDNVRITHCRHHGIKIAGVDASGGVFNGVRIQNTKDYFTGQPGIALEESSGNGNTFTGLVIEYADVGLRVNPAGGVAPSTFVGAYIEQGDPVEWLGFYSGQTTTVGGHLSALPAVKGDRVGTRNSNLTFRQGDLHLHIPAADWGAAMSFRRPSQAGADLWLLKPQAAPSGHSQWGFEHYPNPGKSSVSFRAQHTWGTVEPILGGQKLCDAVAGCGP